MSPFVLKEREKIFDRLLVMFKIFLNKSSVLKKWNSANIYRKGDSEVALHYRLVLLTSMACKILTERIIRK